MASGKGNNHKNGAGGDCCSFCGAKRTDVEIGKALFAVDIAIVCAAAVIYGPRTGLWCILGLVAKTFVVDSAIESIRQRKVCQVICKYPHEVEEFIVRKLGRTATVQTGWGAYSGRRVIILTTPRGHGAAPLRARHRPRRLHHHHQQLRDHRPRLPRHQLVAPRKLGTCSSLRKLGTGLSSPE